MPVIHVLKPFTFTHPATGRQRTTTETRFMPGEHAVSDDIANHPWIASGADGKIETAAQTLARLKAAAAKATLAKEDADRANAHAEAAVKRMQAVDAPGPKGSPEDLEKELNTPVNVSRVQQGTAVDATPAAAKSVGKLVDGPAKNGDKPK